MFYQIKVAFSVNLFKQPESLISRKKKKKYTFRKLKAKCIQIAHNTVTLDTIPHYTGQLATSLLHKL